MEFFERNWIFLKKLPPDPSKPSGRYCSDIQLCTSKFYCITFSSSKNWKFTADKLNWWIANGWSMYNRTNRMVRSQETVLLQTRSASHFGIFRDSNKCPAFKIALIDFISIINFNRQSSIKISTMHNLDAVAAFHEHFQ